MFLDDFKMDKNCVWELRTDVNWFLIVCHTFALFYIIPHCLDEGLFYNSKRNNVTLHFWLAVYVFAEFNILGNIIVNI